MTTNYLKKFVILAAVLMQMTTVSAQQENFEPVYLQRKYIPINNGTLKPSKAPALQEVPVNVYYDTDNCVLLFESDEVQAVAYYIYNEEEAIQEAGTYSGISYEVSLGSLHDGQYTIVVEVNGIAYLGSFDIE